MEIGDIDVGDIIFVKACETTGIDVFWFYSKLFGHNTCFVILSSIYCAPTGKGIYQTDKGLLITYDMPFTTI